MRINEIKCKRNWIPIEIYISNLFAIVANFIIMNKMDKINKGLNERSAH